MAKFASGLGEWWRFDAREDSQDLSFPGSVGV